MDFISEGIARGWLTGSTFYSGSQIMRKSFFVVAVATALTSTLAIAAPSEQRFVRDGDTYVFTSATDESGATVLDGRRTNDGSGFHLVVKGTNVSGISGGQPVSFRISKPLSATTTVASR